MGVDCQFFCPDKSDTGGRAPVDLIGVRNAAHFDELMTSGAKVKDATSIKSD